MTQETFSKEPLHVMGIRVSAIIEVFALLIGLTLVDAFFLDGTRYWNLNPHPFWIPVILLAAQYGTAEGLLAATLATFFLLLGNTPPTGQSVNHYDHLYAICINPILWFVTSWLLGELRQRHVREREQLKHHVSAATEREEVITDSYNFVRSRKEALEIQVSGQLSSSIEAYRAAKAVETLDPKSVMQGVERLVKSVLGPQKFSLFVVQDSKLTATILHGWSPLDSYAQEFDSFSPLYQSIVGEMQTLVVANEEQEVLLAGQGILASPIMDPESRRVLGMLKIELMDFTSLSLSTIETLRALCEWTGTALVNARNYQLVKHESVVNPDRNLLTYNYFKRQSDYLAKLAKRVGFDLSMIVIKPNDIQSMSDAERITVARQIGESVKSVLRNVDLAFDYQTDGEEYSVLLPATSQTGANIVREKIAKDMDRHLRSSKREVAFNYIVQALHESR